MSTAVEDPLYSLFETRLHSGLYDEATTEQLVHDVVELFWTFLRQRGHVPMQLHEPLKADLRQDVFDMLKVKLYGHPGIGEYNRTRRKRSY